MFLRNDFTSVITEQRFFDREPKHNTLEAG